jgi:hypothetical protein
MSERIGWPHVSKFLAYAGLCAYAAAAWFFVDKPGNTVNTGYASQVFLYKCMLDAVVVVLAASHLHEALSGGTVAAEYRTPLEDDDLTHVTLGLSDSAGHLLICAYLLFNFYWQGLALASGNYSVPLMLAWMAAGGVLLALYGHHLIRRTSGQELKIAKKG